MKKISKRNYTNSGDGKRMHKLAWNNGHKTNLSSSLLYAYCMLCHVTFVVTVRVTHHDLKIPVVCFKSPLAINNENKKAHYSDGKAHAEQLTGPRKPSRPVRTNVLSPKGRPSP